MTFMNLNVPINKRLLLGLTASTSIAVAYFIYRWKFSKSSKTFEVQPSEKKEPTALDLKELGNQLFREKKFQEAKQSYLKSLELVNADDNSLRSIVYSNIAATCDCLGDQPGCIENASKAIDLNPHYPKAYVRRASAYEKLDRKEEFIKDMAASIILSGNSNSTSRDKIDQAITVLAEQKAYSLLKTRPIPKVAVYNIKRFSSDIFTDDIFTETDQEAMRQEYANDEMLDQYFEAMKEFEKGNIADCISLTSNVLDKCNINSLNKLEQRILLLRCTARFAVLDTDSTESDVNLLLKQPDITKQLQIAARLRVVASKLHNMDIEAGLNLLQEVMRIDPDRAHTHFFLGQIYLLMSNLKMAELCTKHAMNKDPSEKKYEIQMLVIRAHEAKMSGNDEELKDILEDFKKLCLDNPQMLEIKVEYAQLLHELGDFKNSETLMFEAVEAADDIYRPHVLTQLAIQYVTQNNLGAAADAVTDALAIDENVENALQLKATILYKRGDIIGAISYLQDLMKVARGRQAVTLSMATVIAMETQEILMKELHLPADHCSNFTSFLATFDNL